ncbi:MAG TPA: hypothetical protein VNJ29_02250 [Candidatus Nitrosotenuis sp.]|nr:hypothetical protein [Candidatus Nitrosotenuis sp.]
MNKKEDVPQKNLMNNSAKKGFVNAVYASGIFAILHFVFLFFSNLNNIQGSDLFWFLITDIVLFFGAVIMSTPIGLLGSVFLASVLYKDFASNKLSPKLAMTKGRTLGFIFGFALCVFSTIVFFKRGDIVILIYYYLSAILLSSVFSGRVALQIAEEILTYNKTLD